jgi:A/G-specific adenine glycosylase
VQELAAADEQDVLAQWSGLGYYRRARMMHKAAKLVVTERSGVMPQTAEELRKLPGIGVYTASAIASIAYGERTAVVDGNVERVLSRIRGWESHDAVGEAAVRRKVQEMADSLIDSARPADYNQALMELGATVCTPRSPQCLVCPWAGECRTLGEHKTPKRAPMQSREIACALVLRESERGSEVLLEQRAVANTVMPGLWELPAMREEGADSRQLRMTVRHAVMQVNYMVRVYAIPAESVVAMEQTSAERHWVPLEQAAEMALTGLARKVLTKSGLIRDSRHRRPTTFAASRIAEVV